MANLELSNFKFWCQKVLPLVYDDSISYYETLCKVVDYLNKLIEVNNSSNDELNKLKAELTTINNWIKNFNTKQLENIIANYIATMVLFEITDSGYFVAYIPERWKDIKFGTTGLDVFVPIEPEYGHLVLIY